MPRNSSQPPPPQQSQNRLPIARHRCQSHAASPSPLLAMGRRQSQCRRAASPTSRSMQTETRRDGASAAAAAGKHAPMRSQQQRLPRRRCLCARRHHASASAAQAPERQSSQTVGWRTLRREQPHTARAAGTQSVPALRLARRRHFVRSARPRQRRRYATTPAGEEAVRGSPAQCMSRSQTQSRRRRRPGWK